MEYLIQPLTNQPSSSTEPVVAYNNDSRKAVVAEDMKRGNGTTEYDIFGYQGTKDIVCLDCKFGSGKDVPLQLVSGKKIRKHFRHQQGFSPDGTGSHGETSDHVYGKYLIARWLEDQLSIVPGSISEEFWTRESQLRMDVTAEMIDGTRMAFEVQRRQLDDSDWTRRHGKYKRDGVKDVWLWAPHVTSPRIDSIPTSNLVLDVQDETLGLHLVSHTRGAFSKLRQLNPDDFLHPSRVRFQPKPTHYVSAPLSEWTLEVDGSLTPPEHLLRYLAGDPTTRHERFDPTQQEPLTWDQVGSWHSPRMRVANDETKAGKTSVKDERLDARRANFKKGTDSWWETPRGKQELIDREIRIKNLQAKWKSQDANRY